MKKSVEKSHGQNLPGLYMCVCFGGGNEYPLRV